jgi:hypothetical protein
VIRGIGRVAPIVAALLLIMPGASSAGSPTGRHIHRNVTATADGQRMIREAAGRYGGYGVAGRAENLQVIQDDFGWVIGPAGVDPKIDETTGAVGFLASAKGQNASAVIPVGRRSMPLFAPRPAGSKAEMGDLATNPQPYWQFTNSGCWSRSYAGSNWGYIDTCFKTWKMAQETNPSRDDFVIETYATARGTSGSGLEWAWIDTQPYGSVGQNWVDWAPDTSSSGGCRTVPLGVGASYAGVGASISSAFTWCEQMDVSKGNPYVQIHENWDYCQVLCFQGMLGSRSLRTQEWVWVGQGKWPVWNVNWNVG